MASTRRPADSVRWLADAFFVGSSAHDADDSIIYNPTTGQVTFEAGGLGGLNGRVFATVTPGLSLTAADFVII